MTKQARAQLGKRATFIKNLSGSFEEANESSIMSWGNSPVPASSKKVKQ